jgi:hypothetical protein
MRKLVTILGIAGVLAVASIASQAQLFFGAHLDGPSEFPPVPSPGIGEALVTLDPLAHTMRVQVTFSGLLAGVTASHIHCCTLPTAGVATPVPTFPGFPSGVTSGSYDATFDLTDASSYRAGFITASGGTVAGAEAALVHGIKTGVAYLNIHTTLFPGGEIRGFFKPVPEPGTAALLVAGMVPLTALVLRRRLRK